MKDIEIYPSTKKQIVLLLFKLGLNKDVIEIIFQWKKEVENYDNILYHKNIIIQKTLNYHIHTNFYKSLDNEYIYNNYFKYSIPLFNGIEWCIRTEDDPDRVSISKRIDLLFDSGFLIEKLKKENYENQGEISFEHDDYIYFEPNLFRKIEITNQLSEILQFYEEDDVYIHYE